MAKQRRIMTTVQSWEEIPRFASEQEEARFWLTHTLSNTLLEQMKRVPKEVLPTAGPRTRPVAIRFDEFTLRRIKALAAKRQKGYQTLLKEFVSERLYEEEQREADNPGRSNPVSGVEGGGGAGAPSVSISVPHSAQSPSVQSELDITALLRSEEYSGRVERKLSLLGTRKPIDSKDEERRGLRTLVDAAVALGNSRPGETVFLIFGQRDNGHVAGEVDPDDRPLTPEEVKSARDRLTDLMMQVGIVVGWHTYEDNGRRVWVAEFSGRKRGGWYTTGDGAILVRSGGRTFPADASMVGRWVAERLENVPRARHDAAIERLHQLQAMDEAFSALQDAAESAALMSPLGPPTSWTMADRVAMAPAEQRWFDYWSTLRGLERCMAGLPIDALPTSRQLLREQRWPATAKDLLPTAAKELRQALEAAWADVRKLTDEGST